MYNYNKELVAKDFSRAASRYDDYAGLQRRVADELLLLATEVLPQQARVLDMGCGTGYLARHAPEGWSTTQLDIAAGMCRRAADAATILQGDMEKLPLKSSAVDGIISSLALQWTEPARVFAEAARVLKAGGKVAFSTLGPQTFAELRQVLTEQTKKPHTSQFPDRTYLMAALMDAGLKPLEFRESLTHEQWPDALALMRGIRAMGAANKNDDRAAPLTERTLTAAAARYRELYPATGGIYATWQVWYYLAEKA